MSDRRIEISFDNVSAADANRFAQELETAVRSTEPSVAVNRAKPDSTTQDIGTIVGVVVTSGAALAIAQGIADWIRLRRASITIKENGEVVATGLTGDQSLRLVEILATRKK